MVDPHQGPARSFRYTEIQVVTSREVEAKMANVDYSLYLVTDSTPAILGDRDLIDVVEAALEGGVTLVQYRDKVSDTVHLVATARKLHAVTKKHRVPLLINDRVDVALAVGCEGVHIGQDDLGEWPPAAVFTVSDIPQISQLPENCLGKMPLSA